MACFSVRSHRSYNWLQAAAFNYHSSIDNYTGLNNVYVRRDSGRSWLLVSLILLHAVFLISPIAHLVGFRGSVVIPVTVLVALAVMVLGDRKIPSWVLIFVLASVVTSTLCGAYWGSWRAALLPMYFGAPLLAVSIARDSEIRAVVVIGSGLLILLLIGGWIAVALALSGIPPLGTVSGFSDRVLFFYGTTMTPTVIGDFIRPAGIYDEPGALSLVVSVFAFMRHSLGMDRRITWAMLLMGFVTFSLAHLIYTFIHFMSERRVLVAWANLLVVLGASILILTSVGIWDRFDARLIGRLAITPDSERIIAGDNRSRGFFNAIDMVNEGGLKVAFFGLDVTCIEGSPKCKQRHPGLGISPLTPLASDGLLISWPYYLFLALAIGCGLLYRSWWPLFGVGLLFLQRPNLMSAGYAMLAALAFMFAARGPLVRALTATALSSSHAQPQH